MTTTDLKALVASLNKKLGEDVIVRGVDINRDLIPRCTSGCLSLDVALGGGWPMNQWGEIVGEESSGKTAAVLKTVAANQARDKNWTVAWIDAEGSYDPEWAEALGVDNERVFVITDNGMETVYSTAIEFLKSREVDCVVIDSLPALVPEREDEATMEDLQVGLGALITGKFFRKQRGATKRSLTVAERPVLGLMINQYREKIGVMYGDPRTTPGGKGKNFFFVVRVEVRRDDWIEIKDERVGQTLKFRCMKNKTAVPNKTALVDFYFAPTDVFAAGDYDYVKDVTNVAILRGVISQGGGGIYRYGDDLKWKGRNSLAEAVRADPDLLARLEAEVLGKPVAKARRVRRKA